MVDAFLRSRFRLQKKTCEIAVHFSDPSQVPIRKRIRMALRPLYFFLAYLLISGPGCKPSAAVNVIPPPKPVPQVTDLNLKFPNGACRGKLIVPATAETGPSKLPALLLIHEDHGLTEWELAQGRRLAEAGYAVLAVDLYDGQKVDTVMDAHIMGRALPEETVLAALGSALDYLQSRSDVEPGRLGVIGWDLGGTYALDIARRDPRLKACVICYGGVVTDAGLLAPMKAAVLGIFGGKDAGITDETVAAFRKALQKAGKQYEIKVFPNSPHGFMNPASPEAGGNADPQTTQAAWDAIHSFLAAELKKP